MHPGAPPPNFPPDGMPVFPLIPKFALFNMACFTCFESPGHPVQVFPCSRCKRVSYCNIECQRADFEDHKIFCKAITTVDRAAKPLSLWRGPYSFEGLEFESVERCTRTCEAVEKILGRKLSHKERNLIMFEPCCGVCYRTERDLRAVSDLDAFRQRLDYTRKLKRCQECANLFCCSEAHGRMILPNHGDSSEPNSDCAIARKMMTDDRVSIKFNLDEDGPFSWVPARRKLRITPLISDSTSSEATPWERWFADPSTMFPFNVLELELATMRMLTRGLSLPLTILNAIHQFDAVPTVATPPLSQAGPSAPRRPDLLLSQRTSLEIHIIGATGYDIFGGCGYVYEELLHSLPSCTRLTLRFIGPELRDNSLVTGRVMDEFDVENCDDCEARGIERVHGVHPHLYHDWLPMSREAIRARDLRPALPDLAVIFNGGFVNKDDRRRWLPTVLLLTEYGVPTLVTDVNENYASCDEIMVKICKGKIVVPLQPNPWRSECGTPAPFARQGFLYQNSHYFCFRGTTV